MKKVDQQLKAWHESQMAAGGIAKKTAKAATKASERAVTMARDIAKQSQFKRLEPEIRKRGGQYDVQRLERAFDEVPNIGRQFSDEALIYAISPGDNASSLMVMNPSDFEKFAEPIGFGMSDLSKSGQPLGDYITELGAIARKQGFEDVPFLEIGLMPKSSQLQIMGHEGRHRMRALSGLGDEASLVRTLPRGSVREPLPRRSRQEYIEALAKEHGSPLLVRPQVLDISDTPLILPEQFAKGGAAKKKAKKEKVVDQQLKAWHEESMAKARPVEGVVKSHIGASSAPAAPKIEGDRPELKMAEGGAVDSYQAQQATQAKRSTDIQAYKEGKLGADELVKHFPGMTAAMVEAQLEPQMAAGGEVKMQDGGNAAQIQAQLAAGVPVQMSRGPEGDMARRLIAEEEEARRREEEARQAKIKALPLKEKIRGAVETGQTIQSVLGRAMASPFVALAKGEEAAKEFSENVVLPETEAGRYYLEQTGEFLEPLGKAFEASKLPDTPFIPEIGITYLPGIGRQISGAVKKAAQAADAAIPESLKNLPVGASTEAVGPGGEKISVNELIRRLEAGEDLTPEQRQKAEYSKAQKEKYAQANVAKAQREPTPEPEEVRVPANQSGFFSSVEKAAANLTRKEGTGEAFLSDIMKFNPSAGELEATGIADFLKGKKSVTRQEVQDYINSNKVEIEEVVRGTILDDIERQKLNDMNRRLSRGFDLEPEEEEWFFATKDRLSQYKQPRFEREGLILPGGKNYREILLKLPFKEPAMPKGYEVTRIDYDDGQIRFFAETPTMRSQGFKTEAEAKEELNRLKESLKDFRTNLVAFKTQHWPDDPNTMAHLRMQDMTINGKKTLVIEEIQSDWHQKGRTEGYKDKIGTEYVAVTSNGQRVGFDTREQADAWLDRHGEDGFVETANRVVGVPDAPFKKDWYQLGMKRVMKYAADNDYDQIALVGPEEQIRRGSLGTFVDGLYFKKNQDGTVKLEAERGGSVVLDKTVKPEDLELYVGKDVAKKIAKTEDIDGTLTGDDLKIGGEGMRQYYDRNYPDYMNKLGSKYKTQANKIRYQIKEFGPDDVETVPTGEADRFGREVMAYQIRDPETDEVIGFDTDFEKALKEANKKAPSTDMWLMDLPAKLKSDVKIGQPFKKGGLVKDEQLMAWHKERQMAAGGIAKGVKAAGKAAKRMSRAESEAAGLWHPISETKLAKPIGEYRATVIEDPAAQMLPKQTISIEEMQGGVAIPLAGDRAAAGRIIQEIEGVPMNVALEGGPDFMRLHPGSAWASGKGVLTMLADRIRMARESGQPIYGVYTAMSPQSVDFNTMVTESLLNQLDTSGLRKQDIKDFNNAVKAVKGQGGKPKAPNFPGLDDPEIREKLMSGPGGQRDAFVKAMAKAEFQKKGFPDVAATRLAVTEPELLNVPRGSTGYTVARLDPEARIFEQSGHTTYPLDIGGEYAGGFEKQLPVEIMYPSHFEAKRLLGKTPEGAHKSLELFAPLQYLDQSWLDNAMQYLEMQKKLTGRKKGGLAHAKA